MKKTILGGFIGDVATAAPSLLGAWGQIEQSRIQSAVIEQETQRRQLELESSSREPVVRFEAAPQVAGSDSVGQSSAIVSNNALLIGVGVAVVLAGAIFAVAR